MEPGDFIRRWRKSKGWTQQQLGERLGMGQSMVSSLECGAVRVTVDTARQVADQCEVSASEWNALRVEMPESGASE